MSTEENRAVMDKVNIIRDEHSPGRFKLTVGIFHSFVGYQTIKAANIPKAANLTAEEAQLYQATLQAWINKQEVRK